MSDLFGSVEVAKPFTDIRNQRASAAEEKARLCAELNGLLRKTPRAAAISSIQGVTAFKAAHASALKTLQSKNSSRPELQSAISAIKCFHELEAA